MWDTLAGRVMDVLGERLEKGSLATNELFSQMPSTHNTIIFSMWRWTLSPLLTIQVLLVTSPHSQTVSILRPTTTSTPLSCLIQCPFTINPFLFSSFPFPPPHPSVSRLLFNSTKWVSVVTTTSTPHTPFPGMALVLFYSSSQRKFNLYKFEFL